MGSCEFRIGINPVAYKLCSSCANDDLVKRGGIKDQHPAKDP